MEDIVRDAVVSGYSNDRALQILINLVINSMNRDQPVFSDPLKEPIFWQTFVDWVKAGLEEKTQIEQAHALANYANAASR